VAIVESKDSAEREYKLDIINNWKKIYKKSRYVVWITIMIKKFENG